MLAPDPGVQYGDLLARDAGRRLVGERGEMVFEVVPVTALGAIG